MEYGVVTRFSVLAILTIFIWGSLGISSAIADTQKEWTVLQNAKDKNGEDLGDIDVFGYYTGKDSYIFVECDVDTKKATGRTFYMESRVEEWVDKTVVEHGEGIWEDWTKIRKIDPVMVNIIAPNIIIKESYKYDDGEPQKIAYGPARWGSSSGSYLIPGSDPRYWLIVAEVHNPNSWAVKVDVEGVINNLQESFNYKRTAMGLRFSREDIYLNANETKYVMINQGRVSNYPVLMEGLDWRSELKQDVWTLADASTLVGINYDPLHPKSTLGTRGGFYKLINYGNGPGTPVDLSDEIPFYYDVHCHPDERNPSWEFIGTVYRRIGGWEAMPSNKSINPELAKNQVEKYFRDRGYGDVPYVGKNSQKKVHDGWVFYECREGGTSANVSGGPSRYFFDLKGPVLIDYSDGTDGTLDAYKISTTPGLGVGWCGHIPVLEYRPIFLELFDFEPEKDKDNVGTLKKSIVPGYQVRSSTISRPYFEVTDKLLDYKVEHGKNGWYDVTLNRNITLVGVNGNGHDIAFDRLQICMPNEIQGYGSLGEEVIPGFQEYRDYPGTVFYLGDNFKLRPGRDIILSRNVFSNISVRGDSKGDIEANIRKASKYFNWTGEAAIFSGYIKVNEPDIVSFSAVMGKTYNDKFHYGIGLVPAQGRDSCKWLQPLSYFNGRSSTAGLNLKASDEVWRDIQSDKVLKFDITRGKYDNFGNTDVLWPYVKRGRNYWELSLKYEF